MAHDIHTDVPAGQGPGPQPSTSTSGSNGLALAALIMGIIAVLLGLIPLFGAIFAVPLGIAAIVTGILGRSRAAERGGGGLAITGIVTGAAGILIAILWGVLASLAIGFLESDVVEEVVTPPQEEVPAEAEAPPAPEEAPEAGVLWTEPLDGTFWFEGMRVELQEAELAVDEWGETMLVLRAEFENLTDDTIAFLSPDDYWLELDGQAIPMRTGELDAVPSGGTNRGWFGYVVEEDATLDAAVLYAGSEDQQRAVVPLGTVGELVDGAPYQPDIAGSWDVGDLTVAVTDAEVRTWGRFDRQLDADTLWLELTVDVTYHGEERFGGRVHGERHWRLETPDGRSVAPIESPIVDVAGGATEAGMMVAFEIDDPPDGAYTLNFLIDEEEGGHDFDL